MRNTAIGMSKTRTPASDQEQPVPSRRRFLKGAAGAMAAAGTGSLVSPAAATEEWRGRSERDGWVTTWAASAHGTYPASTATLQPNLSFAFPGGTATARNQSFRMIVRPSVWGERFRLRFSNAFGTQPVILDDVHVGLQASGGALVENTNARVSFSGGRRHGVVIAPGDVTWSDPVHLQFADGSGRRLLDGRKLAVSFHVVGESGPMTWHSKALQTSYVTAPNAGSHADEDGDDAFSYTTTSWYFLDAVDTQLWRNAMTVVAFGDSITDGTGSTLNGDDRWPDVLARRLRVAYGKQVAVANAGIGANRILTDALDGAGNPGPGGPSALKRLERDVLSLSGIGAVIWLEGINDLGVGASAQSVIDGIASGVATIRARRPDVKIIQATIVSSLGSPFLSYGTPEHNSRRLAINHFIRSADIFDGVADFDAVTVDASTGQLRAEFQPNSSTAAIDLLHPNRAGYLAMAGAIDLDLLAPPDTRRR